MRQEKHPSTRGTVPGRPQDLKRSPSNPVLVLFYSASAADAQLPAMGNRDFLSRPLPQALLPARGPKTYCPQDNSVYMMHRKEVAQSCTGLPAAVLQSRDGMQVAPIVTQPVTDTSGPSPTPQKSSKHMITKDPSMSSRRDRNAWCCCSGVRAST